MLLLLGVAAWLFEDRARDLIDRFRLPEVATARAVRPSRVEASAVSGTASNGYIVARVRAALSADAPGRIVEMNVEEGQAVPKGFVVARLYADEYEAALRRAGAELEAARAAKERAGKDVAAATAEVDRLESSATATDADLAATRADEKLARRELARIEELVEEGFESVRLLDEQAAALESAVARVAAAAARHAAAQADLALGEARLDATRAAVAEADAAIAVRVAEQEQAAATLDKTFIRAPFDGIVVLKDAEVGEVVSPNSQAGGSARGAVATMVDFESLEVQAEVPETSLGGVAVGAPARVFLDAYPDRPYSGRVDRIWPTANRQKATVEVRVAFEELDDRLRPEMGVRVVFLDDDAAAPPPLDGSGGGAASEVLLVPAEAIVANGGESGVFVVERDVVRFRRVEIGARRSDRVAVTSGLTEQDVIVLSPPPRLDDGDRVRVRPSG